MRERLSEVASTTRPSGGSGFKTRPLPAATTSRTWQPPAKKSRPLWTTSGPRRPRPSTWMPRRRSWWRPRPSSATPSTSKSVKRWSWSVWSTASLLQTSFGTRWKILWWRHQKFVGNHHLSQDLTRWELVIDNDLNQNGHYWADAW